MVKKIDGIKTRTPSGPTSINGSQSIKATDVKGVDQIRGVQGQTAVDRVRKPTRPMTAAEREYLFKLINEEADKMFGPENPLTNKKETLKTAVKMAINTTIIDEDKNK